ncbi:MAG: DUF202 domain-containing protein [Dissulfurispiraceae bacterium]
MSDEKFSRLIKHGFLSEKELLDIVAESSAAGKYPEDCLLAKGIPKHEILFCLTEYYGYPFVEYDEDIMVSSKIVRMMDLERMKKVLWIPLYFDSNQAEVIAYNPDVSRVEEIKQTLNVKKISFLVALPADIVRIIENNLDLNPNFGISAGRTPLAKVRTFLAERRSLMSCYRTSLAKGRTGLAFMRTGLSFIAIPIVLFRLFGIGYFTVVEAVLLIVGIAIAIDGLLWYLPARRIGKKMIDSSETEQVGRATVLELSNPGNNPCFTRSQPAEGADELASHWSDLSPVMRRRFLASDRTNLAEERTTLASLRTLMARGRNGLAFTRTGVAFAALGTVLLRQFPAGGWTFFDAGLILIGILMAMEGFYWYLPGRRSGIMCVKSVQRAEEKGSIWDIVFPPTHKRAGFQDVHAHVPPVKGTHARGIWATTGLALERTMLADRRNVMARLRTIMARSRTGLAFIRTGTSIAAIGIGLLAYYGADALSWTVINVLLIVVGLLLIADGLYWYFPAEKARKQFPYCLGIMEILIPDYGKPVQSWGKVTFGDDNFE